MMVLLHGAVSLAPLGRSAKVTHLRSRKVTHLVDRLGPRCLCPYAEHLGPTFVIEVGRDLLLVDSPFIEVLGLDLRWPWRASEVCRDRIELRIGDEVVIGAAAVERATLPKWCATTTLIGYRDRSIILVQASEDAPAAVLRSGASKLEP